VSNGNSGERHGRRGHQHRAEMREKARELRHAQRKRDRRGRAAVLISIVTVAVAVIVGVTLVVLQGIPTPSAGPRNMASDGILIGQGLQAVRTEALQPGDEPSASPSPVATPPAEADATEAPTENPVAIRLYYDFQCEDCAEFLTANSEQIETWLGRGAATFELHPIVLQSQGTQYSQRAVNAAACVADLNPDGFWDFNRSLLGEQPDAPANLVVEAGPMAEHLARAGGLVTVSSTAALESIGMGVPTLVLGDFGVSHRMINAVFEGSGVIGGADDLRAGRAFHASEDWLARNYFHAAEAEDWIATLEELVAQRRAEGLPARRPTAGTLGGALRQAWDRKRALGYLDRSLAGTAAEAVGLPLRGLVRLARRLRRRLAPPAAQTSIDSPTASRA